MVQTGGRRFAAEAVRIVAPGLMIIGWRRDNFIWSPRDRPQLTATWPAWCGARITRPRSRSYC